MKNKNNKLKRMLCIVCVAVITFISTTTPVYAEEMDDKPIQIGVSVSDSYLLSPFLTPVILEDVTDKTTGIYYSTTFDHGCVLGGSYTYVDGTVPYASLDGVCKLMCAPNTTLYTRYKNLYRFASYGFDSDGYVYLKQKTPLVAQGRGYFVDGIATDWTDTLNLAKHFDEEINVTTGLKTYKLTTWFLEKDVVVDGYFDTYTEPWISAVQDLPTCNVFLSVNSSGNIKFTNYDSNYKYGYAIDFMADSKIQRLYTYEDLSNTTFDYIRNLCTSQISSSFDQCLIKGISIFEYTGGLVPTDNIDPLSNPKVDYVGYSKYFIFDYDETIKDNASDYSNVLQHFLGVTGCYPESYVSADAHDKIEQDTNSEIDIPNDPSNPTADTSLNNALDFSTNFIKVLVTLVASFPLFLSAIFSFLPDPILYMLYAVFYAACLALIIRILRG